MALVIYETEVFVGDREQTVEASVTVFGIDYLQTGKWKRFGSLERISLTWCRWLR
jgi:hypothetical protein